MTDIEPKDDALIDLGLIDSAHELLVGTDPHGIRNIITNSTEPGKTVLIKVGYGIMAHALPITMVNEIPSQALPYLFQDLPQP